MLCAKKIVKKIIPVGEMGFLSNHVPGTIELGKLKNHNQDYQFKLFQIKSYFFCHLGRSRS